MVLSMDSLRQSMVLLFRTTVVYFGNQMRIPQSSLSRDMGICISFCCVFPDMASLNHTTDSIKNNGAYKSCTRVVIFIQWWKITTSSTQRKPRKWD